LRFEKSHPPGLLDCRPHEKVRSSIKPDQLVSAEHANPAHPIREIGKSGSDLAFRRTDAGQHDAPGQIRQGTQCFSEGAI
jgi:hypothetical protein